jgi:hypothetical protein
MIGRPVALSGGDEARVARRLPIGLASSPRRGQGNFLFYARSMRRTLGVSASDTRVDFRRPRFRPWAFFVRM